MKFTLLVTGATSGIGLGVATRFLAEGHKVIATGRRLERLEIFKKSLPEKEQNNLYIAELNVANKESIQKFFSTLPADFEKVDLLVNNAGLALGLEPAFKAELLEWDQMIDTNIKGLINITNLILPGMIERQKGHIFNIGSVAGTYPYPGGNVYGSTKAFSHEYTVDLRESLLGTPIKVSSIEPGMVGGTEFSKVRLKDEEKASKVYEGIKAMTAADIAEAIYWAASLPAHLNISTLELMPVQQTFSTPTFYRGEAK
jgi:3-hydroxy acid dehydrogenase/malonic semialdehyde reductase